MKSNNMKTTIIGLLLIILSAHLSFAQSSAEQEIINLSKEKWQWMADNPFMVTEVYIKLNGSWKLGSLSFTKLMTPGGQ